MKRLIIVLVLALAAWQGWKRYPDLLHRQPSNQAVVINESGRGIERLRLRVGERGFVRESLPDGQSVTFPFRLNHDAPLSLEWQWQDSANEQTWHGGEATSGPMILRYQLTISRHGVLQQVEPIESSP
jgi:hypothetical protein